jgi:transcriptional regulator with XRE-family HTH domain
MPSDLKNLSANLKYLCAHYSSVAEVCRRLGVNRQQFNKYLRGTSAPSLRNLSRITTFFGVDEYEINLPHDEFTRSVMPRRRGGDTSIGQLLQQLLAQLSLDATRSLSAMRPYCGAYAVYFCSPVWSSHIVRSLTIIGQEGQNTFTKSLERLEVTPNGKRPTLVQKFRGVALYLVDRIYILEYETGSGDLVALTILYPSHRKQRLYLTGIILTVASAGNRQPFASRVVYEYLGEGIDLRAELARSHLYPLDSKDIPEEIRSRIGHIGDTSSEVLLAPSY